MSNKLNINSVDSFLSRSSEDKLEQIIHLDYREAHDIHEEILSILDVATGPDGQGKVKEAMTYLADGSIKGDLQAMAESTMDDLSSQYLKVVANLMSAEAVMDEYLRYLDFGSYGKLTKSDDKININATEMQKSYDRLEEVISDNISILQGGSGVDSEVSQEYQNKLSDLNQKIAIELSKYDSEGNFIGHPKPYQELKKKLISNNEKYNLESGNINSGVVMVQEFLQEFQADIKILKGDIEGFSEIWNVFKYTPDDAQNYINVKKETWEVDKKISDLEEKELKEIIKKGLLDAFNGKYDYFVDFLNQNLEELSGEAEERFLLATKGIIDGIKDKLDDFMYKIGINPRYSGLRNTVYPYYKNFEKLENLINDLEKFTFEIEYESNRGFNVDGEFKPLISHTYDIDSISLEGDELSINHHTYTEHMNIDVLDSSADKLNFEDSENIKDAQQEIYDKYKDMGKDIFALGITALTLGEDIPILTAGDIASKIYKVGDDANLSEEYLKVKEELIDKIGDNFGYTSDGDGNIYSNFKSELTLEEFVLRAGGEENLPKDEDLKDNESFDNWLEEEHEFYVLNRDGYQTGDTYIQSNYETLKNIRDEIEYDIPRPSSDSKHPGFGGYGQ